MKIDDVGSFPVPKNISEKKLDIALSNNNYHQWVVDLFDELMGRKIDCGIEVPCYPQIRPMVDQFTNLLKDKNKCEEDYLIKKDIRIPELAVMDKTKNKYKKACISGPFELALANFDDPPTEIMNKIGVSLNRLLAGEKIEVLSIDEPSLGIRPPFDFDVDELINSWNKICNIDAFVEIHLHSLYFQEAICQSEIDAIDFPTAVNDRNLKLVNTDLLEEYNMNVRVGVSRTNISSEKAITSPEKVADNLKKAEEKLGGMIKFCGPDCGLRTLNSITLAEKILKQTVEGVNLYRNR